MAPGRTTARVGPDGVRSWPVASAVPVDGRCVTEPRRRAPAVTGAAMAGLATASPLGPAGGLATG